MGHQAEVRIVGIFINLACGKIEKTAVIWRTIGVIRHIDQLTRRIPVRIDVKRTGGRDIDYTCEGMKRSICRRKLQVVVGTAGTAPLMLKYIFLVISS